MDQSAANKNPVSSDPTPNPQLDPPGINPQPTAKEPDPIQPGQFVMLEENSPGITKQTSPPKLNINPPPPNDNSPITPFPKPTPQPHPDLLVQPSPAPKPTAPSPPPSPEAIPQNFPPALPEESRKQPVATTPYNPPPNEEEVVEEPSKIKKLRTIVIALGFLSLMGIIAAVAWFFVLGKQTRPGPTKTTADEAPIEEPPPLPKRTKGGFADLPQIPQEATIEATAQASGSIPDSTD